MKKPRGRPRTQERYFDTPQEEAVILYLNSFDKAVRNAIYEKWLAQPLLKMTESIINRYKLYSEEMSFDELLFETLSFLHTKMDLFDPSNGAKAYSYYGTIIKNDLLGRRIKEAIKKVRQSSYESKIEVLVEDERLSYSIEPENSVMKEFFYLYIDIIKETLATNEQTNHLSSTEELLGYAIIELMENWESVFDEGGKTYNKNQVLECLRNITGLNTKDIRENLKKFKALYFNRKREKIDEDYKKDL